MFAPSNNLVRSLLRVRPRYLSSVTKYEDNTKVIPTEEQVEDVKSLRLVRISRPSKNVMQSGTAYTKTWKIEYDSQPRWENWLTGWTSTADPLSNLSLNFPTKEDAIAYCERNDLQWFVEEQPERKIRKKSYADNFSWNKRTRLGNK